jgi:hypothetical protein
VLSYTPTNAPAFQVEMGNIGQHYYQWRYVPTSATPDDATATTPAGTSTSAATNATGTAGKTVIIGPTGTPGVLSISAVQLGMVSDTTFSLSFKTSVAATTEILYGTASHAYASRQDISTEAAQDHLLNLTGLRPGTKYYFALRATADGTSLERKEDFFSTASATTATSTGPTATAITTGTGSTPTSTATSVSPTKTAHPPTATSTVAPEPTSTATTMISRSARVTVMQATVSASNPVQLDASVMLAENASVAVTLAYDGPSGTASGTTRLTNWTRDPANPTATGTGSPSALALIDKQATLVLTATATIPFTDSTSPPLVVTFTRKITTAEYAAGTTFTSPPLNNARVPGYSMTLTFAVSLG